MFANAHSHDFVKMYFGKVGGNNQDDTFIVTQFLEKGIAPEKTNVINNDYQVISVDVETNSEYNFIRNGHNTINGKIIDFGEVYIVNNSTGEAE